MLINSALDFAADNASFRFFDDKGVEWSGTSTQFCCRNNEVHVSGVVVRGPKKWVERQITMVHSLSNGRLIVN